MSVQNKMSLCSSLYSSVLSATALVSRERAETLPENLSFFAYLVLSVPVPALIAVSSATAFASSSLSVLCFLLQGCVHSSSSADCSFGCTCLQHSLNHADRMSQASWVTMTASSWNSYLSCQLFRRDNAGHRLASRLTTITGADLIIPVTTLPYLLMSFWYALHHPF